MPGLLIAAVVAVAVVVSRLPVVTNVLSIETSRSLTIGAPRGGSAPQAFDAADPPRVRLAAAGDVGTGGAAEYDTARRMDAAESVREFDALVLLGDNVYPSGDPARLEQTVFRPFGPVLDDGTDLYAVLGNHDIEQDDQGETQARALGMPGRWYAKRLGDVLIVLLDSTRANDPKQLAWLERTLASATERWRIAAMHFPAYSAGYHGSNEATRRAFSPLLERYGVQLALSGHDHDYQRSRLIDGVTYVVTGGSAKLKRTGRADFTARSWSDYHFLELAVWRDRLEGRAVGRDGLVHDRFTLRP